MDFSNFLKSAVPPLYEAEGKEPTCPKGFKWDKAAGCCMPHTPKGEESSNPGEQALPNTNNYNVWGATGIDGDGWAIAVEEEFQVDEVYQETPKERKGREEKEAEFAIRDKRMKYGKAMEPSGLKRGEVKKFNPETGKWESNK